jgi:hypothetical protein
MIPGAAVMHTHPATVGSDAGAPQAAGRRSLLAAVGFAVLFVASAVVSGILGDGSLPLPGATDAEIYDFFANNGSTSVAAGCCQVASALCLWAFSVSTADQTGRTAGRQPAPAVWGKVSAALYLLCGGLSIALGVVAADSSVATVTLLRDLNFYSGGVAHVVTLGIFTLLAALAGSVGRRVRMFGVIAAVPALASVVSPFVYVGNLFLPLGRVACMLWLITAAVGRLRGGGRPAS